MATSLQSCTKGLWLWITPKNNLKANTKIAFLVLQGQIKEQVHLIVALVVLISSLFLYNNYS